MWGPPPAATLLRIPLQQPHLNPSPFQSLLKYVEIRSAIVIWDHNLWVEGFHRVGRLFGRHGVRQVHAHECDIDVLKRAHLGNALSVGGKIEALAAIGEDVAVVASLRVKKLSG